ncbi:MAG: hypothetical protein ACLQBX_03275 [Candidatus Limnocylindrales bacterium]|jgi:hypothetical protein
MRGLIALGSDDEAGLRAATADVGYTATAIELVVVELENRPGTSADVTRRLVEAGIDLQIAVPVGMRGDLSRWGSERAMRACSSTSSASDSEERHPGWVHSLPASAVRAMRRALSAAS